MNNIYIYPKVINKNLIAPNPYIEDLEKALGRKFNIVNKNTLKYGVLELFQHFPKTDTYLLNWFEDVFKRKYGKFQVLFFIFFIIIKKLSNKKIVWILHNKYGKDKGKKSLTDLMYDLLMKHSDLIITHSNEGINFVEENFPAHKAKVHYLIHPINDPFPQVKSLAIEYDILIWGSIQPYKGILEFLKFVNSNADLSHLKILIVGKCNNLAYLDQLKQEFTPQVKLINEVLPLEDISVLAQKCKFILFPYHSTTLLSSGVLIDSLRMNTKIIGPNSGAFKDLSYLNDVIVYGDFEEFKEIILEKNESKFDISENKIFCLENSWNAFSSRFSEIYNNI
ncbi:hypothetical protein ACFSKL_13335 [Belliella marina]|uniref:Uncharacterized protein n=1 Tax=Belliella marina TaxID=1644146 RepID=A0ABW4VQG7_9BACT